jgi:hypothetical protein
MVCIGLISISYVWFSPAIMIYPLLNHVTEIKLIVIVIVV